MAMRILAADANGKPTKFSMIRPDDWHAHGRPELKMPWTLAEIAHVNGRATLMPNNSLKGGPIPIVTVQNYLDYREAAIEALVAAEYSREFATRFVRGTMYLNPKLTEDDIRTAIEHGCTDFKFYPKNEKHGTTGANTGYSVPSLLMLLKQIEWIAKYKGFLLVHGEDATPGFRLLELEEQFITRQMMPIADMFGTNLNAVFEHATTRAAVEFILRYAPETFTATVTPMHLLYILDSLFEGGLRAKRYCMPIYKNPEDMRALIDAVTAEDNHKLAAGTDDATHPEFGEAPGSSKHSDCGCAGAHPGRYSTAVYASVFAKRGALDHRFENFMSVNGARIRGVDINPDEIVLEKISETVPLRRDYGHGQTVAYVFGGEVLDWQVVEGVGPR